MWIFLLDILFSLDIKKMANLGIIKTCKQGSALWNVLPSGYSTHRTRSICIAVWLILV